MWLYAFLPKNRLTSVKLNMIKVWNLWILMVLTSVTLTFDPICVSIKLGLPFVILHHCAKLQQNWWIGSWDILQTRNNVTDIQTDKQTDRQTTKVITRIPNSRNNVMEVNNNSNAMFPQPQAQVMINQGTEVCPLIYHLPRRLFRKNAVVLFSFSLHHIFLVSCLTDRNLICTKFLGTG